MIFSGSYFFGLFPRKGLKNMYEEIETTEIFLKNGRAERIENSWNYSKINFEMLEDYIGEFTESELYSFSKDLIDFNCEYFDFLKEENKNPKFFANVI